MCGIFGIVLKKDTAIDAKTINSVVDKLFYLSEFRGKEASGLAVKSTLMKEIGIVRKSCPGKTFIKSSAYKKFVASYLNEQNITSGISLLGHTRIATNGYVSLDNQPIVTHGTIGVHNGIICNIEELWNEHTDLERKQVIDTELLIALTRQRLDESEGKNIQRVLFDTDDEMEGMASFGMIFDKYGHTVVGSNCGSFHYINSPEIFVFSSEEYILSNIVEILSPEDKNKFPISQLKPISFGTVNEETLEFKLITEREVAINISNQANFTIKDHTNETPPKPYFNLQPESTIRAILENNIVAINKIKRCTRCILPETHPFIEFDENGVCNYCNDYTRRRTKLKPKGRDLLEGIIAPMKQNSGNNCIVLLSGGRDSCYALHLVKKELGLNPVAYSYDWGMLTDLGRRNQSRMCEKLGVEHIIVSADIKMKRRNIKLNVEAFLKKPHLGMIGLFMAGDKAYHHFAHLLNKRFNLPLIGGGCPLEYTFFKEGFTGAKPSFMKRTFMDRLNIIRFFATQAIKNPYFINASIFDNLLAYKYYFMEVLEITNLFQYLPWDEHNVNETLIKGYNWELAPDTPTSWRIGDGTASFYNYIYYTVAGFTENDCLRSNQINEGLMTREEALALVKEENKARYESLKWYCDTIGVDLEYAIKRINSIPKLYPL